MVLTGAGGVVDAFLCDTMINTPRLLKVSRVTLAITSADMLKGWHLTGAHLLETHLVVWGPDDRFMEETYGTAENEQFQSAASGAITSLYLPPQSVDLHCTVGASLVKEGFKNLAHFMEESMDGHKQEGSEKTLAIFVGSLEERGRHMICSLMHG